MVTLPKTAETPPDDSPALALGTSLDMQSFLGWMGNGPFREAAKGAVNWAVGAALLSARFWRTFLALVGA